MLRMPPPTASEGWTRPSPELRASAGARGEARARGQGAGRVKHWPRRGLSGNASLERGPSPGARHGELAMDWHESLMFASHFGHLWLVI